jgi:hypothetical protein
MIWIPQTVRLVTFNHLWLIRKEEYKIEVLIPPNISDPLNLNAEDDSDYEAKLVSPLIKKKKVRSPPPPLTERRGYGEDSRITVSVPWAALFGCNVSPSPTDVSLTENSWMLHPLDKVSFEYFAPDRTIPSLNSDLIGVLCVGRACIRRRGANQ